MVPILANDPAAVWLLTWIFSTKTQGKLYLPPVCPFTQSSERQIWEPLCLQLMPKALPHISESDAYVISCKVVLLHIDIR